MRILIVNFEYPPIGGGGGVATQQIAYELSKRHEVHVLTSSADTSKDQDSHPIILHRVPVIGRRYQQTASVISMASFVVSAFFRLLRICKDHSFDVINAQFALPSGLPVAIVSKYYSIPFVLSFIGGDIYDPTKWISPHRHASLRWLIRWMSGQADLCTAISHDTKYRAQHIHHVTKEIVVTPLGIVPSRTFRTSRSILGLPDDNIICITIGRLIPRKNVHVIMRAIADVTSVFLSVVGDGPDKQTLHTLAKNLGIQERVKFYGFVSNTMKQQLLQKSDIYISCALHEGFGLVFLEAMDAGLPIIAPSYGGQVDFLKDKENALFINPQSASEVRSALNKLIEHKELMEAMSNNNEKKVKEFYIDKTAHALEYVFERVSSLRKSL